ncbi:MAG: hypothetical protein HY898_27550 [Deltaproteobacteria bacterium]|nr:hypothetical protein [Deltaproteobacteria bacterium]
MGEVPRIETKLTARDRLGAFKVRFAVGRMSYRVRAGLYAVGTPDASSPVLVSANYKLSFDVLRSSMAGRSAWILVLDTKGINVWCAAGKGTFGTDEIVRQVQSCGLDRVVSHRKLIVPQLGAPGVRAHEVRQRCGFRVEYGPVRASDLPAFLDGGAKASTEMRRVRFDLWDRLVVSPVELVGGARKALLVAASLVLLGGISSAGYSLAGVRTAGLPAAGFVLGAFLGATILGPALLPWLPGRAFSTKGAALGLLMSSGVVALSLHAGATWLQAAAWVVLIPALTSFVLMNFTGASTFTSQSGVLREMRRAVPVQIGASAVGLGLWITSLLTSGGRGP